MLLKTKRTDLNAFSPFYPRSGNGRSLIGLTFTLLCAILVSALSVFSSCTLYTPKVRIESFSPAPSAAAPTAELTPAPSAPSSAPSHTPVPPLTAEPTPESGAEKLRAKYLGILGYGSLTAEDVTAEGAKVYRFLINGAERLFSVESNAQFSVQNALFEGYEYDLTVENEAVLEAEPAFGLSDGAASPVSYTPGERTLRNLLASAMQPVGHTLYVYGGGWSWQDDGSSLLTRRTDEPRTWRDFFIEQDVNYSYRDDASPKTSYYPFFGWIEYFYAGLDCSGYLGRTLYCALESEDGGPGYVFKSTDIAKTLSEMGFGAFSSGRLENGGAGLQSGDIVSFKGHAYLVLGRCEDGSIVILHSSATPSRTGCKGGGVQLSAIDPSGKGGGMALALARRYTEKYFPEWYKRYENIAVPYSAYINFERIGNAGFFRWSLDGSGVLSDPDGILKMSADEILQLLFGE